MSTLQKHIELGRRHDIQEGDMWLTDLGVRIYLWLYRIGVVYSYNSMLPRRWWQIT
jgi:hypothetical protein